MKCIKCGSKLEEIIIWETVDVSRETSVLYDKDKKEFNNYDMIDEWDEDTSLDSIRCPTCDEDISEMFKSIYPFKFKPKRELIVDYIAE